MITTGDNLLTESVVFGGHVAPVIERHPRHLREERGRVSPQLRALAAGALLARAETPQTPTRHMVC